MNGHPQRELSEPPLPSPGTGPVLIAKNGATIEPSIRVIECTNAAPSRTADWGTMASPMGPIVVNCDTPPPLGGSLEHQVRKNLFAAGPISPIVDQLDAQNRGAGLSTHDPHGHLDPGLEAVALIQQALSGTRQNLTMVKSSPTPISVTRRFPSLVEESPSLEAYPDTPSGSRLNRTLIVESPGQINED